MAIKIAGEIVISDIYDLYLRDGNFTRDVTIGDALTTHNAYINGTLDMTDGYIKNLRELELQDWDTDANANDSVRLLRRDDNWMFYNGGVAIGNWGVNSLGALGSGNLTVEGDVNIGGKLDLGRDYPCFKAVLSTDHTWTTSWAKITFDSEASGYGGFDVGSNHNTNTGVFTAPIGGIYKFNVQVTTHGMDEDASSAGCRLRQAGSDTEKFAHVWDTNEMMAIGMHSSGGNYYNESHSLQFGTMMRLAANDTVTVEVFSNNTGDGDARLRGIDASNSTHGRLSWFEGRLITRTTS